MNERSQQGDRAECAEAHIRCFAHVMQALLADRSKEALLDTLQGHEAFLDEKLASRLLVENHEEGKNPLSHLTCCQMLKGIQRDPLPGISFRYHAAQPQMGEGWHCTMALDLRWQIRFEGHNQVQVGDEDVSTA